MKREGSWRADGYGFRTAGAGLLLVFVGVCLFALCSSLLQLLFKAADVCEKGGKFKAFSNHHILV